MLTKQNFVTCTLILTSKMAELIFPLNYKVVDNWIYYNFAFWIISIRVHMRKLWSKYRSLYEHWLVRLLTSKIISAFKMIDLGFDVNYKVVATWISFNLQLESPHSDIGVKSYAQNTADCSSRTVNFGYTKRRKS